MLLSREYWEGRPLWLLKLQKILMQRRFGTFADNLCRKHEDQNRYAFHSEMSFLADRYQQLSDDLAQFGCLKIFWLRHHIFKSLNFAKITLAEDEYRLYRNFFDIIYRET
jgi:deoxyadenosine/deoxycytidine kinase